MNTIGKAERITQNRVVNELGYRYLGDWSDQDNSNVDEVLATAHLAKAGYSAEHISRALYLLRKAADDPTRSL